MCGRYAYAMEAEKIIARFDVTDILVQASPADQMMPTQQIPAIVLSSDGQRRRLVSMRWGLVPHFAKEIDSIGRPLINARAETLADKPTFRDSFKRRRCLIPADGFYEWGALPGNSPSKKQMIRFSLQDEEMFAFAGLWDTWVSPETGQRLNSTAIVTCEPNELVGAVHNRMPVMLRADDESSWLDADYDLHLLNQMLTPFPAELMKAELCVTEPKKAKVKTPEADQGNLPLF